MAVAKRQGREKPVKIECWERQREQHWSHLAMGASRVFWALQGMIVAGLWTNPPGLCSGLGFVLKASFLALMACSSSCQAGLCSTCLPRQCSNPRDGPRHVFQGEAPAAREDDRCLHSTSQTSRSFSFLSLVMESQGGHWDFLSFTCCFSHQESKSLKYWYFLPQNIKNRITVWYSNPISRHKAGHHPTLGIHLLGFGEKLEVLIWEML